MIQIIFTRRDTFVSRAIRYLTGEPVSHVALRVGDTIVHSTGTEGVKKTTWTAFSEYYTIVHQTTAPGTKKQVEAVAEKYKDASYDYFGLTWLAARYILKKYIRVNIPKVNLWNITGMFTCTEFVTQALDGKEDSLITPFQLYEKLRERR